MSTKKTFMSKKAANRCFKRPSIGNQEENANIPFFP